MIKHYPYKYRDFAYLAAEAAEAARAQGKFWPMHDLLLERDKLDRDSLLGYAAELGLDLPRFQRELDGNVHRPRVEADVALAQRLDLYQTPTFIVNGRPLVGNRPIERFRALIDEALSARSE